MLGVSSIGYSFSNRECSGAKARPGLSLLRSENIRVASCARPSRCLESERQVAAPFVSPSLAFCVHSPLLRVRFICRDAWTSNSLPNLSLRYKHLYVHVRRRAPTGEADRCLTKDAIINWCTWRFWSFERKSMTNRPFITTLAKSDDKFRQISHDEE